MTSPWRDPLRLARAALAVPPRRLLARLAHEAGRRGADALPLPLRERLAGAHLPAPAARPGYLAAFAREVGPREEAPALTVELLGHPHRLEHPIDWEPAGKGRLWHFTLHYFDWAVAAVANADEPDAAARAAFAAMRSWAETVPFGRYDAWHPYPTAKRLVAWTYLMSTFPRLVTPELERSHWLQVRYLSRSLERHAGGNHLLQDLSALVVAGLRYRGDEAEAVVERALRELTREVPRQVTADGCHVELSAGYHLQVLVMLAETSLALSSAGLATPAPLLGALAAMAAFAWRMRLPDGSYPLWSDTTRDGVAGLGVAVRLAESALAAAAGTEADAAAACLPYPYAELVSSASAAEGRLTLDRVPSPPFVPLAPASGYRVLRAGGLVAVFDGADTGARGMAGHGHADCLNVDVHSPGGPVIVESGTSTYDAGADRDRERSTAAHNTVEVAGLDQSELWGAFRVGRTARTFDRACGETAGWRWATAAHDGYVARCGVTHRRWVGVRDDVVVVLDALELAEGAAPTTFRLRYHLAPGLAVRDAGEATFALGSPPRPTWLRLAGLRDGEAAVLVPAEAEASFHAERFGHKRARALVEVAGALTPGRRYLAAVVSARPAAVELRHGAGAIQLISDQLPPLAWRDAPGPLVPSGGGEEKDQ